MILMLAPGPDITFSGTPSGSVYVSDQFGLVKITNNNTSDETFLISAGCFTLNPFGGWGNFGFLTLADLYAADTGTLIPGITGYPQYTVASVFSDGGNDGTWAKSGTGNGSGNWTQVSTYTLATLSTAYATLTTNIATNAAAIAAETSRAETAEALLAPKASPTLTGTPAAPTATALTSTTQIATTAFTTLAVGVETTRAEAAEATNASAITSETSRAETAEATLTNDLGWATFSSFNDYFYESYFENAHVDSNGYVVYGEDYRTGLVQAVLNPSAFRNSSNNSGLSPSVVYNLGARGYVERVWDYGTYWGYRTSACFGEVITHKTRYTPFGSTLLDRRAHMLNTPVPVDVHISYGQSWRGNTFPCIARFLGNPESERVLALHQSNTAHGYGPLTNGAGINIYAPIDDICGYDARGTDADNQTVSTDLCDIAIGRSATICYQRFRDRYGVPSKTATLEYCHSYPSSTWTTGGNTDGGLFLAGLQNGGFPWNQGLILQAAVTTQLATYGKTPAYKCVGWHDSEGSLTNLSAMTAAYDALNLPGCGTTGMQFFMGQCTNSNPRPFEPTTDGVYGCYEFARANANGRTWLTNPFYPYRFEPASDIHIDAYGTARIGEFEGYAKFCVMDLPPEQGGGAFNPLWRDPANAISLVTTGGVTTITIPIVKPPGPAFVWSILSINSTEILYPLTAPIAGESAPLQTFWGFNVRNNSTQAFLTLSTISISGMNIVITLPAVTTGTSLEVSYAMYGDGAAWSGSAVTAATQPNGTHWDCWGNVCCVGDDGVMNPQFPLIAWLCNFLEDVTAP
jgi:hypothetical protein